ncbi:hypothetical protein BU24DRAFT_422161 [Aaosphaeria arxii CBS 175.79]|uniref:DUF7730 domain-containing protein n=1 Tax=Aaosphaeria arxii CBS 175.79 TaxID=1450172 RepID=A0A6A5XSH6_9PLEO|nr:uncharacterized protein BU24DRAFT_422161 [Aaosphaeria arxii CBS 175.79]KAF2015856.1 hypothetical protein BU24DRAFT_422161 [Aaosphaeria arxii CBS 175.79]
MEVAPDLFSRTFPRPKVGKRALGFLHLPGELRNHVYEHYFEQGYCIGFSTDTLAFEGPSERIHGRNWFQGINPPSLRQRGPKQGVGRKVIHMKRKLGEYIRIDGLQTDWTTSRTISSLTYVCKQIYAETIQFLYWDNFFAFSSAKQLQGFMDVVPRRNLASITKLYVNYWTYGDSRQLDAQKEEDRRHTLEYNTAFKRASKLLVNLKHLEIRLSYRGNNIVMAIGNEYLEPLWQFRRLSSYWKQRRQCSDGDYDQSTSTLQVVKIHFQSHLSSPEDFHGHPRALYEASDDMHQQYSNAISQVILGQNANEAMTGCLVAWDKHHMWRHHLRFM